MARTKRQVSPAAAETGLIGLARMLRRLLLPLTVAWLLLPASALALDPMRTIHQYKHTRWTRAEGAPAPIYAIAQTRDGYLWLATGDGLFRFDGIDFERVDGASSHDLGAARALVVTKDNDLWVSYRSGTFAIYRQGKLRIVPAPTYEGEVIGLAEGPNGDIWAGVGQVGRPMLHFSEGKWRTVQPTDGFGRDSFYGFAVTADGALWISYVDQILRSRPGAARFERIVHDPGMRAFLALDREGRVWSRDSAGVRPLTGPGGRWTGQPAPFSYPTTKVRRGFRTMFDRDGNLWVARRADGIERLRTPSPTGPRVAPEPSLEYFARDGLTSDTAYFIFEDREGNIWVGTSLGLDRFRNAPIAIEPTLTQPATYGDILFAAPDGSVYIAEADTLFRATPGGHPEVLATRTGEPEAICEGPDQSVWVVLADRILSVRGSTQRWISRPRKTESGIYECALDRWRRMWMTAAGSGIFVQRDSGWENIPAALTRLQFYPTLMVKDARGEVWISWGDNILARLLPKGQVLQALNKSNPKEGVKAMFATRQGLLLFGMKSVARLSNGQISTIPFSRVLPLDGANGLVETSNNESWTFGPKGFNRFRTSDLEQAFRDPQFTLPARTFEFADGLPDRYAPQSPRSLVQGGDGRLWAATLAGTVWLDPARIAVNKVPPAVAIGSLTAAGKRYLDPARVDLKPGNSSVAIGFAALSLGIPERVEVRYILEGQDDGWIDPGMRRQAFYTNLGPGNYRFRVIAANEDGVWNRQGATLEFTIPPTFLQSVWFKLLLAFALMALLALAYWLRLRRVTARMQSRFDIRIAERERIARELHDTLLQGFQGLMLQFKAGVNRLPDAAMRKPLDEALARAQGVLIEGRDRVRDLRAQQNLSDLGESLMACASQLIGNQEVQVQLTSEGTPRVLHPLAREELERIFEEAVRNVVSHAQATSLDILLIWGLRELSLSIRDNGKGMPLEILEDGERPGHFGLLGMRERAERIGGTLGVSSRPGGGTEVSLILPARAVYRDHPVRLFEGLRAIFPSSRRRLSE